MDTKEVKVEVVAVPIGRFATIRVDGQGYQIHTDLLGLLTGYHLDDVTQHNGATTIRTLEIPDWGNKEHPLDEVVKDLIIDSALAAKKSPDKPEYGEA